MSGEALLGVRDLRVTFGPEDDPIPAVRGVSLEIARGETLALVGESGCGKSVTALALMRLLDPGARVSASALRFGEHDLLAESEAGIRRIRGAEIGMIFQEPMTSLNPVYRIGDQIGEVLELHRRMKPREARAYTIEMLKKVGIPSPETRVDSFPHQMSGGMKQRVMIAMALACDPALLIADEPTTALDVTIQAQILELLKAMQREFGMSILLITHDLGVVAEVCDRVCVMYAGRIVETARAAQLFKQPRHPYTFGLFQSLPETHAAGEKRLREIRGTVPNPLHWPSGCRFRTRCFKAQPRCAAEDPALVDLEGGHAYACFYPVADGAAAATTAEPAR